MGNYKAKWRNADGSQVTWTTGTKDAVAAMERAQAHRNTLTNALQAAAPAPKQEQGFFSRVFSNNEAQANPAPTVATAPAATPAPFSLASALNAATQGDRNAAAFVALATTPPVPGAPPGGPLPEEIAKIRRMHEVGAKFATLLEIGVLRRACRFAGREPAETEEDEEELMRDGWREVCAQAFGRKELTPLGKVAMGTIMCGAMMYMNGVRIEKPEPAEDAAGEGAADE